MKKNKKWWFWVLAVLLFPFFCLYGIYRLSLNYKRTGQKVWLLGIVPLAVVSLFGFSVYAVALTSSNSDNKSDTALSSSYSSSISKNSSKNNSTSSSSEIDKAVVSSSNSSTTASTNDILEKLNEYTNAKSAGPTKNYYWENGTARLSGFEAIKAGE